MNQPQLSKLESEMTEIKNMLSVYGLKSKNQDANRMSELLFDIEGSVDNSVSELIFE